MNIPKFSLSIPNNTYEYTNLLMNLTPKDHFYHENMNANDDLSDDSDFTNEENDDANLLLQKEQIFESFEEVEKYLT